MPGHTRLYRRGAVYYHRAGIPVDIKDTYPKSEETFSLKTKNYQDALKLVRAAAFEVDQRFDQHRRQLQVAGQEPVDVLTDDQIKWLGDLYCASLIEADEDTRLEGFGDKPKETFFVSPTMGIDELNELVQARQERKDTFEESAELMEELDAETRAQWARGEAGYFMDEAEELLAWDNVGINLKPGSPSWKKLARELQEATITANKAIRLRNKGIPVEVPEFDDQSQAPINESGPMLSAVAQEWIAEKSQSLAPKTIDGYQVSMGHFISIAGDNPIGDYGKADGRAYKAVLMKLPADWNKFDKLKRLDLATAADKAHELGMEPMSASNRNKLLGFVRAFWTWAEQNYDECPPNPIAGLTSKAKTSPKDQRDPFTVDELQLIFKAPIYTGCKSAHFWKQPGELILKDTGIFWVPLISLFTGARAGEIIQLYVDDVQPGDGIWHLDINDDGDDKRLKNPSSRRRLPIHKTLLDIGLIDHMKAQKEREEKRLFPDLKMGNDGYYSSPFSKHFKRFLESVGVKKPTNSFHSFRHSFEDACRNSGISFDVMNALQGHTQPGMAGRYGKGFSLPVLAEEMKKLRYDGLDLSHLYRLRVVSDHKSEGVNV